MKFSIIMASIVLLSSLAIVVMVNMNTPETPVTKEEMLLIVGGSTLVVLTLRMLFASLYKHWRRK